jgi:threonine dehydrogenase-like Zn-dependent dehydrogenase
LLSYFQTIIGKMKAVIFHDADDMRVENVADPKIQQPTDAILKVTLTAICGSDLHFYDGYNPTMKKGDIVGHEFMGEIVEVGSRVKKLKKGDRVIIPFPISCGSCFYCKNNLWSLCDNTNPNKDIAEGMYGFSGAGIYGYSHLYGGISGGQAEYVRVLFADVNAFKVPESLPDEKVLFLTDIFPTGYMAAEHALSGVDIETIAIFGCGPVGQFAIRSAVLLGAKRVIAIDKLPERLKMAQDAGAEIVNFEEDHDIVEKLKEMTKRQGPDAVIDAVGLEADGTGIEKIYEKTKHTLKLQTDRSAALRDAIQACRKGGIVSIPGVYSGFIDKFPLGAAFAKGLEFHMGQCHVHRYVEKLLELVEKGKIDPSFVITHRLPLEEAPAGYKMFRDKEDKCIKIVLTP